MKIQTCITTYERAESLRRLLLDLEREGAVRVHVYDDCSPNDDYSQCCSLIEQRDWTWQRTPNNHGRVGYPRLIDGIWQDLAKDPSADLYVFLQDDNRLCSRFFERLVDTWQSIDLSSKGAMMLLTDTRDTIWGATEHPKPLGKADCIGWVDSMYVVPVRTLHDLKFRFPVIPPRPVGQSSGAGIGLTRALRRLGRTMYRANPSLIAHVSIPSWMHGQERERHPLHAKNFIDGETRHEQLLRGEP
jgi:hypothetical protein